MLEDSHAPLLLTQQRLVDGLPEHGARLLCLDADWQNIARESEKNPTARPMPQNLAYVIYTSGSTGKPKGVEVSHQSVINCLHSIRQHVELTENDVFLAVTTISFDIAALELFLPLMAGAKIVLTNRDEAFDGKLLVNKLTGCKATAMQATPSTWQLMLDAGWTNKGCFKILCGGEAVSRALIDELLGMGLLWNLYGPTETTIWSTVCRVQPGERPVPIGRPIANTEIYILDGKRQPVPVGVYGELYISGAGVTRGYLNRPELTAERFIPNPFSTEPDSRLYRTGDTVRYRCDGNIEFLGRVDHQVKIRGFRIELGEIEAALDQYPAVRQAVVLAPEDAPGERRLVAYLVTDQEPLPTTTDLRSFLREKLPEYMVPALFVLLDALPLMPNGKVDRRALLARDRTRPELGKAFVAPLTPTEEVLSDIWAQVLDIERVGIHDNFFDLGGHSILATQVVSRIREAFHVELPLRRLFEVPTVAGLAESIEVTHRAGQNVLAPPILPVPRDGNRPLSFAQQRLWFLDQLMPGSAYNSPGAFRIESAIDVALAERIVNEIVRRHEVLRTTFHSMAGEPFQVVAPVLTVPVVVVDLSNLSEPKREAEVRRLATEEAQRPFDLSQGPLLRVTLLRLGDHEHVFLVTMHHIISDGWSIGVFIREAVALYGALSNGAPSPLAELPIQYTDFAVWQREWLQGEVLEGQLGYWRQQLADISVLQLPTDHPRPAVQTSRGKRQSVALPKALSEALKALSRQEGTTLFMTLLAAFKIFLHRYTGQDDLAVGTPIANRNRLEIDGLIGFFVNTLVLRTDLAGNPSFRELLRRVREVCLAAYARQDLPFERLVEELRLERDMSRNPLFQVMFVLENISLRAAELPGLTLSAIEADSETALFDLTLQIIDTKQGLTAAFVYNTDLFDAATIARMLGNFQTLLEAVVGDPDKRLSNLALLTKTERQQLLVQWNDTKTDYPQEVSVHELFEEQVERTPDAVAVVCEGEQLTYQELNRRSNQLAHHLRALGVGPEVAVGVCLERSLEMVIGLLAILKAGGVYVPLDPAYPTERLAFMLKDAQVPVLLTLERLVAGLPECEAGVICLDSGWGTIASESGENPINLTTPENLAYIIYTSGSTGQPKGVLVSHGSIADYCRTTQRYYELDASDRVLQFTSLSFDVSLEEILPTLIVGARLVVMGKDAWGPAEFHRRISEFELTVITLPTPYWQELARQWTGIPELVPNIQPRLFIVGGDTMLPDGLDLWRRTPVNSVRLLNVYGPTEATIAATAWEFSPRLCENRTLQRIPIGRPLANREIYILDNYGNPVPVGVCGELCIGGAGIARGYLNRPELTAEKFIPNPFSDEPGTRLYKTGDLARYLPDGNIEFLGRVDHQVKIRGFRIELGEIESALGQYPAVREAIVLARQDVPGERRLVAYVVADQESRPTANDLHSFLKKKLPEHMVPALFVLLDGLPLMPSGKVDRRALPAPDRTRPELEKVFVAPRDDLELQLAQIWEEVLGVHPVGVRDNFFELGGHSLLAARLFASIENRLGKKLPLATVFQGATVEYLAGILRQDAKPAPRSSLVAIQPGGSKRPLFLVHPAGGHVFPYVHLARYLGPDQPCYGLQARGLEEGEEPHTRIEDMASDYIKALRTVQPNGPYLLGGWSMGGLIAFEMAQQLHAQAEGVDLLALLDTRMTPPDEKDSEADLDAMLLADFFRYFGLSLDLLESFAQLPKDEVLSHVLELAQSVGLVPPNIEISQAHRFVELLKSDFQASRNYELHLYPGRVTLFKASEELAGTSPDPTLGWSEWANAGVEVHVVAGNHANMVYQPHVEGLAEKLSECLNHAQSAHQRLTLSLSTDPLIKEAQ
jgi:amino acid adenylation domain-containing protein